MSVENIEFSREDQIVRRVALRAVPVPGCPADMDLVAYSYHEGEALNGEPVRQVTYEGITERKNLVAVVSGEKPAFDAPPPAAECILVTAKYLDQLRRVGLNTEDDEREVYVQERAAEPYSALDAGASLVAIQMDFGNDRARYLDGRPVPVALYFGYLNGYYDNAHYDLKRTVEILRQRADVTLRVPDREWDRAHPKTHPEVKRIPYYNATSGRDAALSFVWHPEQGDYERLVAETERRGGKYPWSNRYRAIFDLDLLGLRAGGAALFDEFYKSAQQK